MSVGKLFSIIVDANVRRNMTGLNIASRESMKSAQVIAYNGVGSIDTAFQEVRDNSNVCIVAAITDLLLSGGDCGTVAASVDPLLGVFSDRVFNFCAARPALQAC